MVGDYRRFGLWKNPFEEGHILDAHLTRSIDIRLADLFESMVKGEEKTILSAICGSQGFGKTESLKILDMVAKKAGVSTIFSDEDDIASVKSKIAKKPIFGLGRKRHKPMLLLFDDVSAEKTDLLTSIRDSLEYGMIVFGRDESDCPDLTVFELQPLTDEEACEIVSGRLSLSRYSGDMNSLYPFSSDFICELNREVSGNPALLIRRSGEILLDAITSGAHKI